MAQGTMKHLRHILPLVLPCGSSARWHFLCSLSVDAFGGPTAGPRVEEALRELAEMCLCPADSWTGRASDLGTQA